MMNTTSPATVSESSAYEALRLAQIHADLTTKPMKSSALLAAEDALSLFNKGDFKYAHLRALDSLSYSVGVFSPVYSKAKEAK